MFGLGKNKKNKRRDTSIFAELDLLTRGRNSKLYSSIAVLIMVGMGFICIDVLFRAEGNLAIVGGIFIGVGFLILFVLLFFQIRANRHIYEKGINNKDFYQRVEQKRREYEMQNQKSVKTFKVDAQVEDVTPPTFDEAQRGWDISSDGVNKPDIEAQPSEETTKKTDSNRKD
ncbi:MAG: hypothetical protein LBC33_03410 [Mycoplasmataceae bacterium]|nr:hypothetical protein [Mycoplasmataceae bacterium]